MPTKSYPLEEGGPDRVGLSWRRKFRDFTVTVDGQRLNSESYDMIDLRQGKKMTLADGTDLHVKLEKGVSGGLKVTRDWKPLPGSATHPLTRARGASILMFIIAGLNAAFLALLLATEDVPTVAVAAAAAWILLFVVLGVMVRRGSLTALWTGIVVFAADTIWLLALGAFDVGWVVVRGALLIGLWKSLPALRQLRQIEAT
ncbi:MAG: hypothetical protein R3258_05610 [Acidimicrobiia bacterium]|nr:hypothetical protein [Acidimicrobiia bacterium]